LPEIQLLGAREAEYFLRGDRPAKANQLDPSAEIAFLAQRQGSLFPSERR
jgi:hypothetical protein